MDCETGGFGAYSIPLQWGMTFVRQRQRVGSFSAYIKREPRVPIHPEAMAIHGITPELIEEKGEPLTEVLPAMIEMLGQWKSMGTMLVGHNILNYDLPLLRQDAQACGLNVEYGENDIIDTGMMVKAAQLGLRLEDRDTLGSFFRRVNGIRAKGVNWSLDKHCIAAYGLYKHAETSKTHDAAGDCELSHHLFEALRELPTHPPEA